MTIPHRNYTQAENTLRRAIQNHRPGRLILIFGVGGVGKTTLRYQVLREIYGAPNEWGVGRIPVIEVMALPSKNAYFNSKAWAEDSLDQLFVPDISWLTRGAERTPEIASIEERIADSQKLWADNLPRIRTEAETWKRVKNNARERQLKIYSLEHASSLCINHKDTTPAQHIINLMSIMESAGSMGLLTSIQTGTELWRGRSEIRRRMDVIWFAPYDVSVEEDMKCYLGLLRTIASRYVFEPKTLIETLAPEIAAATAAVCAEMVNLLDRAHENALSDGQTAIEKRHIEAAYYGAEDLETLWSDVSAFWDARRADRADAVATRADKIWPAA